MWIYKVNKDFKSEKRPIFFQKYCMYVFWKFLINTFCLWCGCGCDGWRCTRLCIASFDVSSESWTISTILFIPNLVTRSSIGSSPARFWTRWPKWPNSPNTILWKKQQQFKTWYKKNKWFTFDLIMVKCPQLDRV